MESELAIDGQVKSGITECLNQCPSSLALESCLLALAGFPHFTL